MRKIPKRLATMLHLWRCSSNKLSLVSKPLLQFQAYIGKFERDSNKRTRTSTSTSWQVMLQLVLALSLALSAVAVLQRSPNSDVGEISRAKVASWPGRRTWMQCTTLQPRARWSAPSHSSCCSHLKPFAPSKAFEQCSYRAWRLQLRQAQGYQLPQAVVQHCRLPPSEGPPAWR